MFSGRHESRSGGISTEAPFAAKIEFERLSHSRTGLCGVRWTVKISIGFEERAVAAREGEVFGELLIVVELPGDFEAAGECGAGMEVDAGGFFFPVVEVGAVGRNGA